MKNIYIYIDSSEISGATLSSWVCLRCRICSNHSYPEKPYPIYLSRFWKPSAGPVSGRNMNPFPCLREGGLLGCLGCSVFEIWPSVRCLERPEIQRSRGPAQPQTRAANANANGNRNPHGCIGAKVKQEKGPAVLLWFLIFGMWRACFDIMPKSIQGAMAPNRAPPS